MAKNTGRRPYPSRPPRSPSYLEHEYLERVKKYGNHLDQHGLTAFLLSDPIFPGRPPYPCKTDSPYYWWYEYLKRVKDYGPKHPLYKDFGDLSGDFYEWFRQRGVKLFAEPHVEVTADGMAKPTDDDLVLIIPLALTMKELTVQIKTILDMHHVIYRRSKKKSLMGRKTFEDSKAKYPLYVTPVIHGLRKTLEVYDLKQKNKTYVQIARELPWLGLESDEYFDKRKLKGEKDAAKKCARATVSRYLKHAKAYRDNVGKGIFPKK